MTAFGPVPIGHALVGVRCPACHVPFVTRDWVAEIPVGPGGDPDARAAARTGAEFTPVTVSIHWSCHTGQDNPTAVRPNVGNARDWRHF